MERAGFGCDARSHALERDSPGTSVGIAAAKTYAKPHLIVDIDAPDAAGRIRAWLAANPDLQILSIGGPRESEAPGIYRAALSLLETLPSTCA